MKYNDGDNSTLGRGTKESNNIFLETWASAQGYGTWCSYICYPNNEIDFSNYSKILVEWYDFSTLPTGYAIVKFIIGRESILDRVVNPDLNTPNKITPIDTSEIKDSKYFYITADNGASIRIKRVWLEK